MEDILHYVWKFKLYHNQLVAHNGDTIEVIDVGVSNTNEGPDFFNAKVKINGTLWAGDIEIHHNSKQWIEHKHHINKSYNAVILHVVKEIDCNVINEQGRAIPQCIIEYSEQIDDNYNFLIHSNIDIPCANYLGQMNSFHLNSWMHTLLLERLERKAKDIERHLVHFSGSWEDTFYTLLARNFGFGLNADPFERLALSLPLKYIQKQADSLMQIEALLFGQAGMLPEYSISDDYQHLLYKEYCFLKEKYKLKPLDNCIFKNMRIRPTAFPQIRIAQLAALLHSNKALFSKITHTSDVGKLRLIFHVNASDYWQTHYTFGATSAKKSKFLGDGSLDTIIINTVVPILFAYGKHIGDEEMCERSIFFLETLNAERNSITKSFSKLALPMQNAFDSQACIQLRCEYCEKRKCLYCRIAHKLLSSESQKL